MRLGLSCVLEKEFLVDTLDRYRRNISTSEVISYSMMWIHSVSVSEEEVQEDGKILHIIDARKQYCVYVQCVSTKQACRLPKHKF